MTGLNTAQPDITLMLDAKGVIRDVALSRTIAEDRARDLIGRPWMDTLADTGGEKARRMVEDARANRVSVFRQVTQHFPSGRELLLEYTTVRLDGGAGFIAVGRNLQAVADLQSRLIAAQQAMERDYWKLRQVESRYRLLFDASAEAVLLIRVADLRIVEANPAAIRALDLATQRTKGVAGRDLLAEVLPEERDSIRAVLMEARAQGRAPGILVHFGRDRRPWLVRVSLMASETDPLYLLQLAPTDGGLESPQRDNDLSVEEMMDRCPDGFVVLDREGAILHANRAFLDLIQIGTKGWVIGERLGRWLGRPGADMTVLLATVQRHGVVRLFSTTIHGELGTDTEVELSAAGDSDDAPDYFAVVLRDIARRLAPLGERHDLGSVLLSLTEQIGKSTLRTLVKDTVKVVEKHYVASALELTGGNRTAAAELLGLSRQSLYAKLDRYGLHRDAQTATAHDG